MEAERASPFSGRTVAILIGAGVVFALGFLLLSGFGSELGRLAGGRPGVESRAATGFYALRQLVAAVPDGHVDVAETLDDLATVDLLILTPTVDTRREDIDRILRERDDAEAPTLIILPKWETGAVITNPGWVRRTGWLDQSKIAALVPSSGGVEVTQDYITPLLNPDDKEGQPGKPAAVTLRAEDGFDAVPFAPLAEPQTIVGTGISTRIGTPQGEAVLARIDRPEGAPVYVLSDPDLVNNQGMASAVNARAAMAMLATLNPGDPGRVVFDRTLFFSPGERNLIKLMFTPPFLSVTIALIAAALLAGFASAVRFGPARRDGRALALGKSALVDTVTALTRLAGKAAAGGGRYADAMRERVVQRLRPPHALTGDALVAWLDARTAPGQPRYSDLDARARSARTEAELLRAAQQLDDWRKDVSA